MKAVLLASLFVLVSFTARAESEKFSNFYISGTVEETPYQVRVSNLTLNYESSIAGQRTSSLYLVDASQSHMSMQEFLGPICNQFGGKDLEEYNSLKNDQMAQVFAYSKIKDEVRFVFASKNYTTRLYSVTCNK